MQSTWSGPPPVKILPEVIDRLKAINLGRLKTVPVSVRKVFRAELGKLYELCAREPFRGFPLLLARGMGFDVRQVADLVAELRLSGEWGQDEAELMRDEYAIHKGARAWTVVYEGHELTIADVAGMDLVAGIIRAGRGGTTIERLFLYGERAELLPRNDGSPLDAEALKDLRTALKEPGLDPFAREKIEAQLKDARIARRRGRYSVSRERKNLVANLYERTEGLYRTLKKNGGAYAAFGKHLEQNIKRGRAPVYLLAESIRWNLK